MSWVNYKYFKSKGQDILKNKTDSVDLNIEKKEN